MIFFFLYEIIWRNVSNSRKFFYGENNYSREKDFFRWYFFLLYCAILHSILKLGLNEIRSANEVKKTIKYFLHKFNSQYSGTGPLPVSFVGPLNEALRYSLFDPTLVKYWFFCLRNKMKDALLFIASSTCSLSTS